MTEKTSDNQVLLLQAIAAGDNRAFEAVYRRYSPWLFAIALRIVKRRGWAEEVLHDSFLIVLQHAASYDPTLSAPQTWLTHIVRNRAIDFLRRQDNRVVALVEETAAESAGSEPEETTCRPDSRRLLNCMSQLPAEQRQSVSLAYYQGLSHSEVALHLQQPAGTVKSWIRRALMQLKACMEI